MPPRYINYRSVAHLSDDIKSELHRVPRDVSLVVGIPRSGLLAANLLALYLNLPLVDIDSFLEGRLISTGVRGEKRGLRETSVTGRILVVDDSIYSGEAMEKARRKLSPIASKYQLYFCAVYGLPGTGRYADLVFHFLEAPRIFEWNIFGDNRLLETACLDIDGVLCRDPSEAENDDGERYAQFLCNAEVRMVPKVRVGTLVTSRLERYRPQTEAWLAANGINYNELVMLDLPDKASRIRLGCHANFKAAQYAKRQDSPLFVESAINQAEQIFKITGKPVYSVDTNEMLSFQADSISRLTRRGRRELEFLKRVMKNRFEKILKAWK